MIERLGLIEAESVEPANLALLELLSNAIEHGNFEISFDDKRKWLAENSDIYTLIEKKQEDPKFKDRYSTLEISIFPTHVHFQITDMGKGFDWRAFKKKISEVQKQPQQHGYGIAMALKYTSNMTYNNIGNVVSFDMLLNEARIKNDFPDYFVKNNPRITLKAGELLMNEEADSISKDSENKVYLIVDGELAVFKGDRQVGIMFADDVFCGELGYLLQRKRSATLIANTPARLISIKTSDFFNLIQNHDFCKLLISRVLAERLERAHLRIKQIS